MSLALANKDASSLYDRLQDRGLMLKKARAFFDKRGVLEVDCPILSSAASVDAHIDLIEATALGQRVFLHSSPEYGMKKLLSCGIGDIYQLSHVFRDEEKGAKHNPEFLMAEWYRIGFSLKEMMRETAEFLALFLEKHLESANFETIAYRDAFLCHVELDPETASVASIYEKLQEHEISFPKKTSQEELLDLCYSLLIEPHLGTRGLTAIKDYPASQAALAKTKVVDGRCVAERFEFYFQGVELANGYHELIDPLEQKKRFMEANQQRAALGKSMLPIDEEFLEALEKGLPDCCGVAVGVDRLMMLRHDVKEIHKVTALPLI